MVAYDLGTVRLKAYRVRADFDEEYEEIPNQCNPKLWNGGLQRSTFSEGDVKDQTKFKPKNPIPTIFDSAHVARSSNISDLSQIRRT